MGRSSRVVGGKYNGIELFPDPIFDNFDLRIALIFAAWTSPCNTDTQIISAC